MSRLHLLARRAWHATIACRFCAPSSRPFPLLSLTTRLSLDVAATAEEVEKAMYDACKEASGTEKEFTFANDMVSPKVSLFTAAIEAAYEPK